MTMAKAQIAFSDFVFLNLPTVIYVCYGITMCLTVQQYAVVGLLPSLFRVIAWQCCLLMALSERGHIKDRSRLIVLEQEFGKALDTIGIRRNEFLELKGKVHDLTLLVRAYIKDKNV